MMLKLLLWSLLSGCVSATTMDLKTGDDLTLNCSSHCISNIAETVGLYLYRDAETVVYYAKEKKRLIPYEDANRIKKSGNFEKMSITILNVTVKDSGFYRCAYKIADEKSCSMYRVSISEVSSKKTECFPPDVPPTKTPAPAPIPVIVIAAVTGLIVVIVIVIIFTLCVIPKVKKRMRSGESEAQMQNIYEVMSRS